MRPITVTVGPLAAASATNIRTATSISGAGAVTLNGTLVSTGSSVANGAIVASGIAVLDNARRVIFTSSGNDTGVTFTTTGTDGSGNPITETVTGASGAAATTVLDYKTFSVSASGASAGTVSIGTNTVAASPWVRLDDWQPWVTTLQVNVSGTVNYTVQTTLDDPNSPTNSVAEASVAWFSSGDSSVVSATTSKQSSFASSPVYTRLLLNSSTSPGYATMTVLQSGTP